MPDETRDAGPSVVEAAGRLGPLTFPSLIHDICEERTSGVLTFREGEIEKSIVLDSGRIVFAKSNDKDDRLGALLLRRGMVRLGDLESAVASSLASGQRLGGVMVQMGLIRPQDLVTGVRDQVKEIVVSLFHWTRGQYEMSGNAIPSKEVITLKMSTEEMVLEGVKRIDSWQRIALAVGSSETRYQVTERLEEVGRAMNLSLEEWTLLSRCEGPVTLRLLCETSPLKDYDVCRLVWAFNVVGMLKRLD